MTLVQFKQPPKVYISLMLILCLISIGGGFQYLFKPLLSKRSVLISEFTKAKDMIDQSQSAQLPSLLQNKQKTVDELLVQLRKESEQRSKGDDIPGVLLTLDKISENNNVTLSGVDPLGSKRVNLFDELEFNIRLNGSYKDIFSWLSEAEETMQPMSVERIHIVPSSKSGEVSVQLKTISYLLPSEDNS